MSPSSLFLILVAGRELMREVLWICHSRYRWFTIENPGCTGFRDGHDLCGWYEVSRIEEDE